MTSDLDAQFAGVQRGVAEFEYEGRPAKAVRLTRTYRTSQDDLWDAITDRERLARWFLPVTGELEVGGRYQLKDNAEGTITRCEAPDELALTWEFAGQMSWVEVRLSSEGDGRSRLTLAHIQPADAPDEHWEKYGPGAGGLGWDLGLLGLAYHVDPDAGEPLDEEAFGASAEGRAYIIRCAETWGRADAAAGAPEELATARAKATAAFYTGDPVLAD
jgi:uncharacterized protein YndB with AHSA1/START domain